MSSSSKMNLKIKVGVFSLLGFILIGAITVFVNDKPFWWRGCQLVHINVEDGTGLRAKSPVRSLGLEIGYLKSVELSETHVRLGICITAPVKVMPSTRAYVRGEGFLGDKFIELKPVKYVPGMKHDGTHESQGSFLDQIIPQAHAEERLDPPPNDRVIPVGSTSKDVQHLVDEVDGLVGELRELTGNLREALDPDDIRSALKKLNQTLDNASRTLSPEGGLTATAQRVLNKLEDAIEQLRDQVTRVNQGKGSIGMLLNDPYYAEELGRALRNLNAILSKTNGMRLEIELGAQAFQVYRNNGGRGFAHVGIWPTRKRYYRLGMVVDPRGVPSNTVREVETGSTSVTTETRSTKYGEIQFTAMLGWVLWERLDLSLGLLFGDGALSVQGNLGPTAKEEMIRLRMDLFSRVQSSGDTSVNARFSAAFQPYSIFYVQGLLDSIRKVDGAYAWGVGAGVKFDDEDVKFLLTLFM